MEVFFPAFTGREPLFIYVEAVVLGLLGQTVPVLRGVAALIGVLAVGATALCGRALFGRAVGLLGAGLLAASFWHTTISRMAYRADLVPLVAPLAVFLLWRAWERPTWLRATLAGLAWGVLAYTYVSVRLLPVALALFAVVELAAGPLRTRARLASAALFVVVAGLVAAPLGVYFLRHPDDFGNRFNQTSTIANESAGPAAATLIDGVLATLRMYGVRGDDQLKYNLPLRPALDPLLALAFAIGVAVLLWRIRESGARLTLAWLVGSLAPGFVTADSPNFLRLVGAAPPSYLVAALGAWTAGGLLLRARAGWLAPLAVLLVGVETVLTTRAYFGDWAVSPDTYYALHGDMADIGRLAALQASQDPTYVSSEHYKHPTVAFVAGQAFDRLRWFDGRFALPLPLGSSRYLLPRSTWPRDPTQIGRLTGAVGDPSGGIGAAVYRRDGGPPPLLRETVGLSFLLENGPVAATLLGADPPLWTGRAGDTLVEPTIWRIETDAPNVGLDFFAHAVDADGRRWGQRDASPYLTAEWHAGEALLVWLDVPVEPSAPAGQYRLRLGLDDSAKAKALAMRQPDGSAGPPELLVAPFQVAHARARPTDELIASFRRTAPAGTEVVVPTDAPFAKARLVAAAFPATIDAGAVTSIDLMWVAAADQPAGDARLVLKRGDGPEQDLGGRTLESLDPGTPWLTGEGGRDVRPFAPTRAQVGTWSLLVRLAGAELVLGQVEVRAPPAAAAVERPQRAASGQFDELARLVGFDVLDGRVRLHWQALGAGQENYTVFVHALDADDHILAQNDAPPAGGARPTRGWAAGETILDEHPLTLPAGAKALAVGLYDARTGQRVGLVGGGDRLVLPLS